MKLSIHLKVHLLVYSAMALLLSPAMAAQGKFTNFETPHVKPITTARITSGTKVMDVVLVVNSPDNSVEIYDAAPPHTFFQRVPVGMGPTSVRWNIETNSFYTCNFDGDSITRVELDLIVGAGGALTPAASVMRTIFVGDQPADIAFDPTGAYASVTLSGRSESVIVHPITLNVILTSFGLTAREPSFPNGEPAAPKAPRQVEWLSDGRSYTLNFMGDQRPVAAIPSYDLDMWYTDPAVPPPSGVSGHQITGLGTTNQAFAINSAEDKMVVVGTRARNHDTAGESALRGLPLGFVESHMWIVNLPAGGTPVVQPLAASGGTTPVPTLRSRNLNQDYSMTGIAAVAPANALAQPSDVTLIEDSNGDIQTIALTAFHSNKISLLTVNASVLGGYAEVQIPFTPLNPASGYSVVGPSGITFDSNTGLLYVACRLDSSLRVVNPATGVVTASISLNNDPTPQYIRSGRQSIYDATFSSFGGIVSCASCHPNGTTDGLAWDLDDGSNVTIPAQLQGDNPNILTTFPPEKGPLITQTLQGLVNYEVNPEAQYLLTNAPYHWRADRTGVQNFNPAFQGLMKRQSLLSPSEIFGLERFVHSIHHPPNPEQPGDRLVSGTLGSNPDDPTTATGGKLGLQIFHNFNSDASGTTARSCVGCHTLPEGSDNLITETGNVGPVSHPFDTAALRNLVPRESLLRRTNGVDLTADPPIVVSNTGLTHDGLAQPGAGVLGVEHFATNFFVLSPVFTYPAAVPSIPNPPAPGAATRAYYAEAVSQYTRQFDWGTAPAAMGAYTVIPGDPNAPTAFTFFEDQVKEANCGFVVFVHNGPTFQGYYYDLTASPPGYRLEGSSTLVTSAALLALANASTNPAVVVLQGTPLGNERRIASATGVGTQLGSIANPLPSPANVNLEPMAPMTYCVEIPKFLGLTPSTVVNGGNERSSNWALATLRASAATQNYGVTGNHHEPPRRLRVTGDNIRHGAILTIAVPNPNNPPSNIDVLALDLFPTKYFANERRVWETEEEIGPIMTMALLNGGPHAPDVLPTLYRSTTTPTLLNPLVWNQYLYEVTNEDGTVNPNMPAVPLTIQNVR